MSGPVPAAWQRGRKHAISGHAPSSTDPQYLAGYESGEKRRLRGHYSNVGVQRKMHDDTLKQRWGVKRYNTAKRCPCCGFKGFIRVPFSDRCLGCVMKEETNAAK